MPILVPSLGPESWKALLADPDKHWQTGYSAKSLAYCWSEANGLPPEVRTVLERSPIFAQAQLLIAIPEHTVPLPGAGRASQTDLWLLLRTPAALTSVAIEGKVDEPFDAKVGEWLAKGGENRRTRLTGLAEILGIDRVPDQIRYQLLHRTASAVLEARRFLASHAVMLVYSFSQEAKWYKDFVQFCELLGGSPAKNQPIKIPGRTGPTLYLGWIAGDLRFVAR